MGFEMIWDDANIGASCSILVKCFHGPGAEIHKAAIEWSIIWLILHQELGSNPAGSTRAQDSQNKVGQTFEAE